jgi:hypothetical protein
MFESDSHIRSMGYSFVGVLVVGVILSIAELRQVFTSS